MGRIPAPTVRAHLRYQLFLPLVVVGPIHRIDHFEHQCQRRRWDAGDFLVGMERVLIGLFMAKVIGGWLIARTALDLDHILMDGSPFLRAWASSAMDWVLLYFVFAGLSGVALGTAAMIGLKLEENFNAPWNARSLLDFWQRWHMTLSRWALDYVFRPVMALTRRPALGVAAAMLAIGLWHELSAYYVLWAVWQALGIGLNRLLAPLALWQALPARLRGAVAPLLILGWLSLTRPLIELLLEALS
jgi:alginate O-acetyltransferase complex protein AlgI